ncbi:MAG: hypothetical protein AB7E36_10930 [Salinivirgaceae bacterium]
MLKFLKNTALFTLSLPLFIVFFTILWGLLAPSFLTDNLNYKLGADSFFYNRIREANQNQDIDVLVLGASQAYRGFDPRVFSEQGISLFNLGSSNQTQVQTEALVNTYLSKLNPKVVLFVVNPESFSMDGIESSIDLLCNGPFTKQTVAMVFKVNSLKTYFTFIYAGFRQLFRLDKNFSHPTQIGESKYVPGGYVERNSKAFVPKNQQHFIEWKPRVFQQKAFEQTLQTLKTSGVEIILIQAPLEFEFTNKITNLNWYHNYFTTHGVPYLNYTNFFPHNREYFYDEFHLNQKGVEAFNTDIIQRVKLQERVNK